MENFAHLADDKVCLVRARARHLHKLGGGRWCRIYNNWRGTHGMSSFQIRPIYYAVLWSRSRQLFFAAPGFFKINGYSIILGLVCLFGTALRLFLYKAIR